MMPLIDSENAITNIEDFFMNMMVPTWCFQRGMLVHLWNYWLKKYCENLEEKIATGNVSSYFPGPYAGKLVKFYVNSENGISRIVID